MTCFIWTVGGYRNHLILWDLESGYIKGRMKASHTEFLLSSSTVRDRQSQIPPNETTGNNTRDQYQKSCARGSS